MKEIIGIGRSLNVEYIYCTIDTEGNDEKGVVKVYITGVIMILRIVTLDLCGLRKFRFDELLRIRFGK